MKKILKLLFLLLIGVLIGIPASYAADYCECQTDSFAAANCTECANVCHEIHFADTDQRYVVKSCSDSTRFPGSKDCTCSFRVLGVSAYDCRDECAPENGIWIEEERIEEGTDCSRQEDCVGGGTCGTDRCFCNPETNKCKFKKDSGSPCLENYECHSNICTAVPGGEGKTCKIGGLTPPGEGEAPPLSEEEVFPTYKLKSPIGEVTGPELIGRIIKTVLGIVGALALAMFVYGGFTWLTSGGSPDKIQKGKDILMWAVIGLIIIFTSYTLVDFVLTAFGL